MIDLTLLDPFARKTWIKRRYDEYESLENTKAIELARLMYTDPDNDKFDYKLDKSKWKTTIDRKLAYLLGRPPVSKKAGEVIEELLPLIRETAKEFMLRGSLIWIVQGDGESIVEKPMIMNNTIAIYRDESKEETACYIRKYTDIELDQRTGGETEQVYYEVYYGNVKETFCYTKDGGDKTETLSSSPLFIELGKTGDAPLFAYVSKLLEAWDHVLRHQDTAVEKNIDPLVEVKNYQGTSDADLQYALQKLGIIKVDGQGGVTVHTRTMDSAAMDLWARRLAQEYYEATATVGKDNELIYAQSGKAMDRLFIDMENSALMLGSILGEALKEYLKYVGITDVDIIWNTDRPVDDVSIISGIMQSRGLISDETLIEQHPWVSDIAEERRRLAKEQNAGMEDLVDDTEIDDTDLEGN